jgi:hypothetical protein
MSSYAYINKDGFVVFTSSGSEPSNVSDLTVVELEQPLPPNNVNGYAQFNWESQTWIDTRTDQQKYDEADFAAKEQRNKLLYSSDWTQIPNNPLTTEQQQEWASYRQSLRDITNQPGYPYNIGWPTPPLQ